VKSVKSSPRVIRANIECMIEKGYENISDTVYSSAVRDASVRHRCNSSRFTFQISNKDFFFLSAASWTLRVLVNRVFFCSRCYTHYSKRSDISECTIDLYDKKHSRFHGKTTKKLMYFSVRLTRRTVINCLIGILFMRKLFENVQANYFLLRLFNRKYPIWNKFMK